MTKAGREKWKQGLGGVTQGSQGPEGQKDKAPGQSDQP